jgi:DNA segregation ATPase FtsK/SpoIIIE, S-DNA-T family
MSHPTSTGSAASDWAITIHETHSQPTVLDTASGSNSIAMPETSQPLFSLDGLQSWWDRLQQLLGVRRSAEQKCLVELDGRIAAANRDYQTRVKQIEAEHISQQNANQKQNLSLLEQLNQKEQAEWVKFDREFRALESETRSKHQAETATLARKRQYEQWELRTRYDGIAPEPRIRQEQMLRQLVIQIDQQADAFRQVAKYLAESGCQQISIPTLEMLDAQPELAQDPLPKESTEQKAAKEVIRIHDESGPPRNYEFSPLPDLPEPNTPPQTSYQDLQRQLREQYQQTANVVQQLPTRWSIKIMRSPWPWSIKLICAVAAAGGTWFVTNGDPWYASAIAAGIAMLVVWIGFWFWRNRVLQQLEADFLLWHGCRIQAVDLSSQLSQWTLHQMRREQLDARSKYKQDLSAVGERFLNDAAILQERQRQELHKLQENRGKKLHEITDRYRQDRVTLEQRFAMSFAALDKRLDENLLKAKRTHEQFVQATHSERDQQWQAFLQTWNAGHQQLVQEFQSWSAELQQLFPDWNVWQHSAWQAVEETPTGIPLGTVAMSVAPQLQQLKADPAVAWELPTDFQLPALMDFPRLGSLVIQAAGAGREAGLQFLQAYLLRLLLCLPAGKTRFTIIDPVGLGKNFAGMMHLTDFDEALVTSRIWTETQHIEQRLLDLSEQIEIIIQKYLRNEYETIADYNRIAGEVAEPYRFLVVANFPRNFTEAAARRLLSIANSGPRCGIYVLLLADMEQQFPSGFALQDLADAADLLTWEKDHFVWRNPELAPYAFTPVAPPSEDLLTKLVQQAGQAARQAKRVEVAFTNLAPAADKYWTESTQRGFEVPLGRAGARKHQLMKLGSGTSQHVLIAGKTGSGKSTLLHALITNAALRYSPDELEYYLIDFKKGVEFKDYAQYHLPHARVIAIESEREFGLSVLQRLDAEMQARGELFRDAGKQDLAGYRESSAARQLPRILLIIDEFQEFFTEDDRVAQQATLLFDRLVRQGRAFGIHLLLGSQTLGGAFTLARSTISQMAVRIALQCSETDAELILSDSNSAARLLSRPGEAIYNDANGRLEGNSPFQVAWLNEAEREEYLQQLEKLAQQRREQPHPFAVPTGAQELFGVNDWRTRRQMVFEGNAAANIAENRVLTATWKQHRQANKPWDYPTQNCPVWLGDPVSIKDPTTATFARQPGANLMILGQAAESAQNVMGAMVVSLAAQGWWNQTTAENDGIAGGLWVIEANSAEESTGEAVPRLYDLATQLHLPTKQLSRREIPDRLADLAAEVERRTAGVIDSASPIVLVIHNLSRFRDFRRDENDFGFSSFGSEPAKVSTDKHWAKILREGPAVGVHTIVWCDTLANMLRCIERSTLREFDQRILFQMNPSDSSQLVDSPAASKLGKHFALFSHEETGVLEKFRPYAWPDANWLTQQMS